MDGHSELRLVTCLFVDVVGSTDATVRLGPERMQRLLGDAFMAMSAEIADHGGTVEKYVGDAIFALFGATVAHADDAERALRAADACVRWSTSSAAASARLAIRVGIETGEALVNIAAVDQRQRMAVGEAVNVAARLQQHAEPGEIVVGPTCREATNGVALFEPVGSLSLKGIGDRDAWRFTEFRAGEGARQVGFVGREAELRVLGDAFDRANRGTATLALIVGPPGQGKTRLAAEAIRASSTARIIQARCRPGSETGINTPLRQIVNADLVDATPASMRARMLALLPADDALEISAAVCHSAGLAVDERLLALGRLEQRALIADAWRRYLAAVARAGPLITWIEDMHWADPVVVRIIDQLTTDLEAAILVLATARPEFVGSAHLRPGENRIQIDLEPLDPTAAERLAHMVGDATTDSGRAAGNPLFIIELARSRSGTDAMPVTIQAAIAARLDELSTPERELLQHASVAGETFNVRDAALLGELDPAEVAGLLGRVAHLGFVMPIGSMYRFHHALAREVAYGRLPASERMTLHARYAEEGVDPGDLEASAHHWWEALKPPDAQWVWEDAAKLAGMRREAFRVHLAAGRRLEERNAYEEALEVFKRAIGLADDPIDVARANAETGRGYARQGRGDEAWEHRTTAIEMYAAAGSSAPSELYADMLEIATLNWGYFQHLPDDAEVLRRLDEGERTARASGDDVSLARLLVERASFTNEVAGTEEVTRFAESDDAARFADAAQRLGEIYLWNGKVSGALELYQTVFERLLPVGAIINEPEALLIYGAAEFNAGNLGRADALADRLKEEAVRRSVHTRQHALSLKALLLLAEGAWESVSATARELTELVDANPDTGFCLIGASAVGYGAIADLIAGRQLPKGLAKKVARMVPESRLIQASSVMLPRVMAGTRTALTNGIKAYASDLRLWDRARAWDVCDLMPAIALTVAQRWDELGPTLARLDEFAGTGGRLAAATAAAIREEEVAAKGGPAPKHEELLALGCAGISQLLGYRPASG